MVLELALLLGLGQGGQPSVAAQELARIEQRLAETWKKGECAAWGALVAPEWSVTHITGAVITRDQALKMCEEPDTPIETMKVDDLSIRIFGDAAVVTGRTTVATGGASPVTLTLRFTDVFVRRAGRWQVVASHATRLDP
jgi:hypothetical protein